MNPYKSVAASQASIQEVLLECFLVPGTGDTVVNKVGEAPVLRETAFPVEDIGNNQIYWVLIGISCQTLLAFLADFPLGQPFSSGVPEPTEHRKWCAELLPELPRGGTNDCCSGCTGETWTHFIQSGHLRAPGFTLWWNPGWERLWTLLPIPEEVAEKLNWALKEIQNLARIKQNSWSLRFPKFGFRGLINPLGFGSEPRKAILPEEGLSSQSCVGCRLLSLLSPTKSRYTVSLEK